MSAYRSFEPSERIARAMVWAQNRLLDCNRTMFESRNKQSRDWAYGEKVAIEAMLHILNGGDVP
jgi:hypothetical protein